MAAPSALFLAFADLPLGPQAVMLAGPIGVDLAARHGGEGPLDAERAPVNMDDDRGEERQGGGAVPQGRVKNRLL